MKNLIIYISKYKKFNTEGSVVIKVQIDNSLELGWKREDILLVTNFPYEYNGVKSIIIGDNNFCEFTRQASKINAILTLFESGLIKDEVYFFHDLDVFQMEPLKLEIPKDSIALTDYGGNDLWNTGVMFFRINTWDIFKKMKELVYKYKTDEERALMALTGKDVTMTSAHSIGKLIPATNDLSKRIIKLNPTYNFIPRYLEESYKLAEKPIKCVHFHPIKRKKTQIDNQYASMIHGNNSLGIPIVTDRLKQIFNKYV